MAAPALVENDRRRVVSVSLRGEDEQQLRALADALYDGSLSVAVRHLVAIHCGKEIERAKNQTAPKLYEVDGWRKRRLTRELISEICGRVRDGATRADAYRLSGVTTSQASTWTQHGKRDVNAGTSSVHADLVMTLERVEAEVRVERNKRIGAKDPKWLQEREYGDQYGKVTRSDSSVTHKIEPLIVWENLSLPEARTLVALMRKASPAADDPSVSKTHRPAAELIPAEMIDGEALEVDDESPGTSNDESPSVSESPVTSERLALDAGPPSPTPAPAAGDARHELERESDDTLETRADRE